MHQRAGRANRHATTTCVVRTSLAAKSIRKSALKSTAVAEIGPVDYRLTGDLTIRGVTRPEVLDVRYLGAWQTPWWEDGVDKGPKTRAGFTGRTRIDRYQYGVNWNDDMPDGGIVVSR